MEKQSSLNDGVRTKEIFGMKFFHLEELGSNAILLLHNPPLYDDRQQNGELNHKNHAVEMLESYSWHMEIQKKKYLPWVVTTEHQIVFWRKINSQVLTSGFVWKSTSFL